MLTIVQKCWKLFPITLIFSVVSFGLFFGERACESRDPEARRALGGATERTRIEEVDGVLTPIREFSGPFDVWNGEGWRIAVNAFIHGDVLHLVSNLAGLGFLGYWLESRTRRWDYFAFFMIAGVGSILIEFLLGNSAVGCSGALYAIFGRLLVMRYYDEDLREEFSESVVGLGIIWLILCVSLTATGLMPIANAAHFFGFFYGLLVGLLGIKTKWLWSRRFAVTTFIVAHALLIPGFYFVTHPVWEGRYQWFRSEQVKSFAEKEERLEMAVKLDPGLARAWHRLAMIQLARRQERTALATLANGVFHNRSNEMLNESLEEMAVRIHNNGSPTDRAFLTKTIGEVFADEADGWNDRLERVIASNAPSVLLSNQIYFRDYEASLPGANPDDDSHKRPAAPRVDPMDPDSAVMGVTL